MVPICAENIYHDNVRLSAAIYLLNQLEQEEITPQQGLHAKAFFIFAKIKNYDKNVNILANICKIFLSSRKCSRKF